MTPERPHVVYWNNIPSPYMVERFDALAERGQVRFEAWFDRRTDPDRSWDVQESAWRFDARYLPTVGLGPRRVSVPSPLLGPNPPDVLFSLYAGPSYVLGWSLATIRGVRTGFRVLAPSVAWVPRGRGRDALKRFMFRRVGAAMVPGADAARYATHLGTPPARVRHEPQVIAVDHFAQARDMPAERERLRSELGLTGLTFLYVGRLWLGKGVDMLLDAFEQVRRTATDDVHLLLVGDGADEAFLRSRVAERQIRGVVFAGFEQRGALPAYYAASDVFVFPTLGDPYGLVVDEALAAGLPVITTREAGEITARIRDGENGFIVAAADPGALAEPMKRVLEDPALVGRLARHTGSAVAGRTPETWARAIEEAAFALLGARA